MSRRSPRCFSSFFNFSTATSFAFASISTVIFFRSQAPREVFYVDKVVAMTFPLRPLPAFNRAGDVKHWLSVPGNHRLPGDLLNTHAIRIAAMMMHIVDQRQAFRLCRPSSRSAGVNVLSSFSTVSRLLTLE